MGITSPKFIKFELGYYQVVSEGSTSVPFRQSPAFLLIDTVSMDGLVPCITDFGAATRFSNS